MVCWLLGTLGCLAASVICWVFGRLRYAVWCLHPVVCGVVCCCVPAVSRFFRTPPLGGYGPNKNIPPLCVKKFRNPNFFLNNTTSCFFILYKRSIHNALRTPNIPYFAGTNLVPLNVPVSPKFSHQKARVLAVGPQQFWLGVKLVRMTLQFFLGITTIAQVAN